MTLTPFPVHFLVCAALVHGPEWTLLARGRVSRLGNWDLGLGCGSCMAAGSGRKFPWVMGRGVGIPLGLKGVLQEGGTRWGVRTHDCHRGWGWRAGELFDPGLEVRLLTLALDEMTYTIKGSFWEPWARGMTSSESLLYLSQMPCSILKTVSGGGRSLQWFLSAYDIYQTLCSKLCSCSLV